jgi:LacI family transcriptional regulator
VLDEDVPGANVTRIFVENEAGAYEATRHLIAAGHRRIAHIGGPQQLLSSRERFAGFARAMAEAGFPVEDGLVRFGAYERDFGRDATRAILANGRPTAVFTGSDYIAVGVLQELAAHGLSVPGDLSLASFDDMPFADLLSPPITTVRQPIEALGRLGIRTLLAQIRGGESPPTQRLPTELVIRRSVGPPPGRAKKAG